MNAELEEVAALDAERLQLLKSARRLRGSLSDGDRRMLRRDLPN